MASFGKRSTTFRASSAAFLMTLVRKGKITTRMWHQIYGASLLSVYFVSLTCSGRIGARMTMCISMAALLRFRMAINKYIVWTSVALFDWLLCLAGVSQIWQLQVLCYLLAARDVLKASRALAAV